MARMDRRLTYPIALVAGVVLAFLAATAMGFLAAIPTPAALRLDATAQPALAFLVSMTLLVHLPAAILAFAAGWLLFRALGQSSWILVLICAAPWLAANFFLTTQFPPMDRLHTLLHWYLWPGILAVPVGLWLASIAVGHKAR
jgi:hypothetical protein